MSNNMTWVVLTDGYYIKIMFYQGQDLKLNTYRADDFEHSSKITYKLITKMKDAPEANECDYFIHNVVEFLAKQFELKVFDSLILVAPEKILKVLNQFLPDNIKGMVKSELTGDFLLLPQDKLESMLARKLSAN